jgi:hypothetical protein
MRTNVRATNWPTRNDAAHNVPRESRKGARVASARTKTARFKRNVEKSIEERLALAQRHFARVAGLRADDGSDPYVKK